MASIGCTVPLQVADCAARREPMRAHAQPSCPQLPLWPSVPVKLCLNALRRRKIYSHGMARKGPPLFQRFPRQRFPKLFILGRQSREDLLSEPNLKTSACSDKYDVWHAAARPKFWHPKFHNEAAAISQLRAGSVGLLSHDCTRSFAIHCRPLVLVVQVAVECWCHPPIKAFFLVTCSGAFTHSHEGMLDESCNTDTTLLREAQRQHSQS